MNNNRFLETPEAVQVIFIIIGHFICSIPEAGLASRRAVGQRHRLEAAWIAEAWKLGLPGGFRMQLNCSFQLICFNYSLKKLSILLCIFHIENLMRFPHPISGLIYFRDDPLEGEMPMGE